MGTRVLTAHVPADLAIKVDEVANRIERSRGWVIKQGIGGMGRSGGHASQAHVGSAGGCGCGQGGAARRRPGLGVEARHRQVAGATGPTSHPMMEIRWTSKSLSDLARLHEFLNLKNPSAAAKAVQASVSAPEVLLAHPRIGERIEEFAPREVRRLLALHYETRYEIQHDIIYMLRIWHTRGDR